MRGTKIGVLGMGGRERAGLRLVAVPVDTD